MSAHCLKIAPKVFPKNIKYDIIYQYRTEKNKNAQAMSVKTKLTKISLRYLFTCSVSFAAVLFYAGTAQASVPTVTTGSASASAVSGAETLAGDITDFGGSNATERGFQYGPDTNYGSTASETGSFRRSSFPSRRPDS